jgi:predicted nucleotide-binding protein (sugar kinase/HSP70/actin superfamily)
MKKKTIGIPRAFLYYRYKILWKNYFQSLGYNIVLSDITTKETIEVGKKYSIDEACLSSKIYLGHIYNLKNRCDYILIPRICNYGKGENVCVKFNANYDIVKNIFPNLKILDYNIEKTKKASEFISLIKLGLKLNKNIIRVLYSYIKAKIKEKKYNKTQLKKQNKKLKNKNTKILIVSHPYNTYDEYIGIPIINKIQNQNIEILYSDIMKKKLARKYSKKLSPTLYWTYSKELIGSIEYYKNYISGIIYLTSFPCGPDSLVNELMLRKINNIPSLNIIIDEQTSEAGLETRIESFIDIIKERRDNID